MKRRSILGATIGLVWAAPGVAQDQPRFKVSAEQLQRVISARFPVRYPVGNLFTFDVEAPNLRLLPEWNRLATEMVLHAAGGALRRSYRGSFDVDFALRYEAGDQSIRAHGVRVRSFRLPGLSPDTLKLLDAYGQVLAEQALLEIVLYRLGPRDLALAAAMGLQPADITVTAEGLAIGFAPKPSR